MPVVIPPNAKQLSGNCLSMFQIRLYRMSWIGNVYWSHPVIPPHSCRKQCVFHICIAYLCPPPLRLPRCLAAPSPPVSLSRLLVTSPPRLLGSSTPASSCTGCVALLLSVCTAACAVGGAAVRVDCAAVCASRSASSAAH